MHRWRNQLSITAVAFILGLLVVIQLRSQQADPGLATLSTQELTLLVGNLSDENNRLQAEVSTLERELAAIGAGQARGDDSVDQLRAELARVRAWTGLEQVYGPGVTITVDGPLDGPAVEDLLNELRNAGAEAIAIDGIRIVPGVVVVGAPGEVVIDGQPLGDSFEIRAIGGPPALTGSLTRVGGIVAVLGVTHPEALLTITPVERMDLPATSRTLVPIHGRPRL
jgi:uncharacterized protein YlxW (UPF0749 family)